MTIANPTVDIINDWQEWVEQFLHLESQLKSNDQSRNNLDPIWIRRTGRRLIYNSQFNN
jgi:hypothetical protein